VNRASIDRLEGRDDEVESRDRILCLISNHLNRLNIIA
jgi:hypothetical protein